MNCIKHPLHSLRIRQVFVVLKPKNVQTSQDIDLNDRGQFLRIYDANSLKHVLIKTSVKQIVENLSLLGKTY